MVIKVQTMRLSKVVNKVLTRKIETGKLSKFRTPRIEMDYGLQHPKPCLHVYT